MLTKPTTALLAVVLSAVILGAWWLTATTPPTTEPAPLASSDVPATTVRKHNDAVPFDETADEAIAGTGVDEDSNTEIVFGRRVRKDRRCTMELVYHANDDGTVTESVRCVSNAPPGEFEHYTNEELLVLAYDSAPAAYELGKRLHGSDPVLAKRYILRAVALEPGNITPIAWLAALSSERGTSDRARRAIAEQYELTRIKEHLDPREPSQWVMDAALEAGFTLEELHAIDARAQDNLEYMRTVQIEVFGEPTIGEDGL